KHPCYRELIESVTDVLSDHPRVLYISGHDHGLQLIQDGTFTQVVSGSGAKTSDIRTASDLRYRFGQQGVTVMDFLTNGETKVSFYVVDKDLIRKDFETSLVDGKGVHETQPPAMLLQSIQIENIKESPLGTGKTSLAPLTTYLHKILGHLAGRGDLLAWFGLETIN